MDFVPKYHTGYRKDKRKFTAYLQTEFGSKSWQHAPFSRETSLIPPKTGYKPTSNPSQNHECPKHLILCASPTASGKWLPRDSNAQAFRDRGLWKCDQLPSHPHGLNCLVQARLSCLERPRGMRSPRQGRDSMLYLGARTEVPEAVLSLPLWGTWAVLQERGDWRRKGLEERCCPATDLVPFRPHITKWNSPHQMPPLL